MTRTLHCAAALFALAFGAASASAARTDAPPPYAGDVPSAQASAPATARSLEPRAPEEGLSLAPTEADMARARDARAHGEVPPRNNDRKTRIDEVRDPNNHVTEYVVTPGSTKIPYRIENRSERPIDTTPGGSSGGTLGTPKFIEFGW